MLITWFGFIPKELKTYEWDPESYFNTFAEESWFNDEWTKNVIRVIDDSECFGMYNIKSKILGGINYQQISAGSKLLIAAKFGKAIFNGNRMGDNCHPLMIELAKEQDIYISLTYYPTHDVKEFDALIVNNMLYTHSFEEYELEHCKHFEDVYEIGSNVAFEKMKLNIAGTKATDYDSLFDDEDNSDDNLIGLRTTMIMNRVDKLL